MSFYDDEDLDGFEYDAYEQGKKEYAKGFKQGREKGIDESIKIISEMQTDAEANMLWVYVKACDKIIAQLKQLKEE